MSATHLHLLSNHIPVIASFIGLLVLIAGMIFRNREVRITSACILLVAGIGGVVASRSGEEAEEYVEHLDGFNESAIHEHEEAAERAMPFVFAMTLLAALSIFAEVRRKKFGRVAVGALLISAIAVCSFTAYAAYNGGKIRHQEVHGLSLPITGGGINGQQEQANGSTSHEEEDHDD